MEHGDTRSSGAQARPDRAGLPVGGLGRRRTRLATSRLPPAGQARISNALRPDRLAAGDSPDGGRHRGRARAGVPGGREGRGDDGGVQEHRLRRRDVGEGGAVRHHHRRRELRHRSVLRDGGVPRSGRGYGRQGVPRVRLRQQAGRQPAHSSLGVAELVVRRDVSGALRARRARRLRLQLARERDHSPRVAHVNRLS